jgi:ribosomal protein L37E
MRESYMPKYYTLDYIPEYRKQYIDIRLQWFVKTYELKNGNWPLDCVSLLKKMKKTQKIPFTYSYVPLPNKYDALTGYVDSEGVYIMQININKAKYPFEYSRDRRLNFTIAHEIGHIVLEHLLIPRSLKTGIELFIEEHEANEFAGRLLMPEKMLCSCNYYSIDSVAQYFIVSRSALWKRLNNMKRLDLLNSRKIQACSRCGNTRFSVFAGFCGICGQPIGNKLSGIRRVYYPEVYPMDQCKRVTSCPRCNNDLRRNVYDKCSICGTHIFNFCSSFFDGNVDECSYANPGNCRFCEMCGRPTYFFEKGLLKPWQEADDFCYVAESRGEYI